MIKKEQGLKIFMLRLEPKTHKELRKLSYLTELPMAELIRDAIKNKLKESKKMLTNADIAI